jgi:oxygen-independent coproporphyrinogen-3 oxidase
LLKTGQLNVSYFQKKYGVDIRNEFQTVFEKLQAENWLTIASDRIECTRDGLIQIDRHLPAFFDPQYVTSRYT